MLEKESKFVRFHALQGFVLKLADVAFGILVAILSGIFAVTFVYSPGAGLGLLGFIATVGTIISVIILIFAIIAVVRGFQYIEYKIPLIGNVVIKFLNPLEKIVHKNLD